MPEETTKKITDNNPLAEDIVEGFNTLNAREKSIILKKIYGGLPVSKTFYSEKYALQLLPDLEDQVKTNCILAYPYSEYPEWRPKTLYLYICNAYEYIRNYMDPNGIFTKHYDKVQIKQIKNDGVRIIPVCAFDTPHKLKAHRIPVEEFQKQAESITRNIDWKSDLWDWIEKKTLKIGDKYERKDTLLSDSDVGDLTSALSDSKIFEMYISPDRKHLLIRKIE
jgi:hypothetical protein